MIKSVNVENEETKNAVNNDGIICQVNVFSVCNIDNDAIINNELQLEYPTTKKKHQLTPNQTQEHFQLNFRQVICYLQPRKISLTCYEFFKFMLQYHDQRFARDPRFSFFAMNAILRHDAISKSSLYMKSLEKCTI